MKNEKLKLRIEHLKAEGTRVREACQRLEAQVRERTMKKEAEG